MDLNAFIYTKNPKETYGFYREKAEKKKLQCNTKIAAEALVETWIDTNVTSVTKESLIHAWGPISVISNEVFLGLWRALLLQRMEPKLRGLVRAFEIRGWSLPEWYEAVEAKRAQEMEATLRGGTNEKYTPTFLSIVELYPFVYEVLSSPEITEEDVRVVMASMFPDSVHFMTSTMQAFLYKLEVEAGRIKRWIGGHEL